MFHKIYIVGKKRSGKTTAYNFIRKTFDEWLRSNNIELIEVNNGADITDRDNAFLVTIITPNKLRAERLGVDISQLDPEKEIGIWNNETDFFIENTGSIDDMYEVIRNKLTPVLIPTAVFKRYSDRHNNSKEMLFHLSQHVMEQFEKRYGKLVDIGYGDRHNFSEYKQFNNTLERVKHGFTRSSRINPKYYHHIPQKYYLRYREKYGENSVYFTDGTFTYVVQGDTVITCFITVEGYTQYN